MSYLLPGFHALVSKVREGSAGNESPHTGGDVHVTVFHDELPLANYHLWGTTELHALEHVVLGSLRDTIVFLIRQLNTIIFAGKKQIELLKYVMLNKQNSINNILNT